MDTGHAFPVRVGIIGAGVAGNRHAAAYQKITDVRLMAISDPDPKRGGALAQEVGAQFFEAADERFWESVDAVSICTPHSFLSTYARAAIDRRKPLLLEKPMALTLNDADAIISAAEQAQVPLMVGFVHRFRAELQMVKQSIESGVIGTPTFAVEHLIAGGRPTPAWIWHRGTAGGGVGLYNGVHGLDRLRWLLGREVREVYARAATVTRDADVEDLIVATLIFEGDLSASFVQHIASYPLPPGWRSEIYGTKGALLLSPDETLVESTAIHTIEMRSERDDHFVAEVAEFIGAIRDSRPPAVSGADGRAALAIALAIYQSVAEGRPVPVRGRVEV